VPQRATRESAAGALATKSGAASRIVAMKGDDQVLEVLNEVLTGELTAMNQYFVHAKMCDNWGYRRLAHHGRDESIDEMKHAERVVERILYLEGVPNLQRLFALKVGETVVEQLHNDLAVEVDALERLHRGIALAIERTDVGTRELLADILVDEEEHVDWLETQLETIRQVGLENYLAQQMHD
jgi:bacterioferritin